MSLQDTPRAERLHIGLFGRRNSGKSSLVNALTGQDIALVSDVAGTTTDPVYKAMEVHGIGPAVFIDTAGFDDEGELGKMRVEKTRDALRRTDIAIVVFGTDAYDEEFNWIEELEKQKTPVIAVINKMDIRTDVENLQAKITERLGYQPILVSAREKQGIDKVREAIIYRLPEDYDAIRITAGLVDDGDLVMLVMPQDIQAPKGRLILPQVQTLRELLDTKCIVMSTTTDKMESALAAMSRPPKLIITDSQVFREVYAKKPEQSMLTSFSVLFAQYKGDLAFFAESAAAIDSLTEKSHVLIAEACTHVPLHEDIGRVKLPRLLRKRIGEGLTITHVSGVDFPRDLSPYDMVIHCGACMFNRKYVLSRVEMARMQKVPMSNYGVVLAYLTGILDKIVW